MAEPETLGCFDIPEGNGPAVAQLPREIAELVSAVAVADRSGALKEFVARQELRKLLFLKR